MLYFFFEAFLPCLKCLSVPSSTQALASSLKLLCSSDHKLYPMSLPTIVPLEWYLSCFLPHFKHLNYLSTNLSSNSLSGYINPSNTYFEFLLSSYLFQTFQVVAICFLTFVSYCFSSFRLHNII